jgi:two-component system response regulator VicR
VNKRILLIEDDDSLGLTLLENLQLDGFEVTVRRDGESGLEEARKVIYDAIVLDRMLPLKDGLDVLTELRRTSQVPVLMISAKGSPHERIEGLEALADDYLSKPFHLKEFKLRLESLIRRSNAIELSELSVGLNTVDLISFEVLRPDSTKERLSMREGLLLKTLAQAKGAPVSRDDLAQALWKNDANTNLRTIDNLIVKLRKLLGEDPQNPQYLISHRGIGYSLRTKQ